MTLPSWMRPSRRPVRVQQAGDLIPAQHHGQLAWMGAGSAS
jgi:hypothetical protein